MSYELKESEHISADSIVVKDGFSIKVLEKIVYKPTKWGMKPSAKTELRQNGLTVRTAPLNYNQPLINGLIRKSGKQPDANGKYNSDDWIGLEIPVKAKEIKGNLAIVPVESR